MLQHTFYQHQDNLECVQVCQFHCKRKQTNLLTCWRGPRSATCLCFVDQSPATKCILSITSQSYIQVRLNSLFTWLDCSKCVFTCCCTTGLLSITPSCQDRCMLSLVFCVCFQASIYSLDTKRELT